MQKNKKIENTTYDSKSWATGKSVATVADVSIVNGMLTSKVVTETTIDKTKMGKSYLSFKCTGGEVRLA